MTWELIEMILKKPLEEIIDFSTGKWNCNFCSEKRKFFSKEAIVLAAKEKKRHFEFSEKK